MSAHNQLPKKTRLFIVCGEVSGDLHAATLVKALAEIYPGLTVSAVGGTFLAGAGARIVRDIKEFAVMGLFDVIRKLPAFVRLKKEILEAIEKEKPDALILVDFSGFNLRLAASLDKRIPVIYYVSPQVWASRPGRVETIKKYVSKMIVFFPFEEEFYKRHGFSVECVGHPLLDIVSAELPRDEFRRRFCLPEAAPTLALLPGSRKAEIKKILPVMLESARLVRRRLGDLHCIIAKPAHLDDSLYDRYTRSCGIPVTVVSGHSYDCLNAADAALVCSGTATLETAIMGVPFALVYKMNLLNYLLYRPQVKLPYIGLANIVAGKRIVPEFIQFAARPQKIADCLLELLRPTARQQEMKTALSLVKASLGVKGAARRAAQSIRDFLAGV